MKNSLLVEFDEEMASTRRILTCVPEEKLAWRPHDRSFTMAKLANHIAALPVGVAFVITGQGSKPTEVASTRELLDAFDSRVAVARDALAQATEAHLAAMIQVLPGVTKTRGAALRWMLSHMIHHRGQLSVYLRLIDRPVPGMYGASADEK